MSNVIQFPDRECLSATVAGNIRAEASRHGWNQSTLARALGTTHTTVQRRWVGRSPWPLDDIERVAELLGLDTLDLLRARRDSNPQPSDLEFAPVYSFAAAAVARGLGQPGRRLEITA